MRSISILSIVLGLVFFVGCTRDGSGETGGTPAATPKQETTPAGTTAAAPTTAPVGEANLAAVQSILDAKCTKCHGDKAAAGVKLTDKEGILKLVTAGDAAGSKLVTIVSGEKPRMPKGGAPLTAAEIETLKKWIADGAK